MRNIRVRGAMKTVAAGSRYEAILLDLARQYKVQMPSDQLFIKGEAFALRAGGRSPRVAKQFVELLAAGVRM